jgi:ferredoxin
VLIAYGVSAGLGQLGLNGQLLTPEAGSRCRLAAITTGAPVVHGHPVDYGIELICDTCQLCVRRCPVGAIPMLRREHRGVVKAKIKTERCFPTVAQAHGCAVCMKVCPVQRYGLPAVDRHFAQTGEILGKGTDELEGFAWPLDGRFYGAGRKPRIQPGFVNPPGWHFDKDRTVPPADAELAASTFGDGPGTAAPAVHP